MSETITEIKKYEGNRYDGFGKEAGFQIVTTEQVITLAIDDQSSCCEQWGYFLTEDDTNKFVGQELRGVKITDTNRSTKTFKDWREDGWDNDNNISLDAGEVMFVDIETDRGPLQFVAYNAHNGYYGHEARIDSKQLEHSKVL